jgi:hypothetical protein
MKYIKLFESLNKDDFFKRKKELEEQIYQELGDEFVENIIAEGNFDDLNFLLQNGYDLRSSETKNLLVVALENNQIEMFEYLLKNYDDINSISLFDIIGQKNYNGTNILTDEKIKLLKIITDYGYKYYDKYNLIDLYLKDYERSIIFIDWLLKNYPDNYKLVKHLLTDRLKEKYKYLEKTENYNL